MHETYDRPVEDLSDYQNREVSTVEDAPKDRSDA
jgi:hypothetical protein